MPICVTCACGKKCTFKDEFAGRRGKCPACGQVLSIQSTNAGLGLAANSHNADKAPVAHGAALDPPASGGVTEPQQGVVDRKANLVLIQTIGEVESKSSLSVSLGIVAVLCIFIACGFGPVGLIAMVGTSGAAVVLGIVALSSAAQTRVLMDRTAEPDQLTLSKAKKVLRRLWRAWLGIVVGSLLLVLSVIHFALALAAR